MAYRSLLGSVLLQKLVMTTIVHNSRSRGFQQRSNVKRTIVYCAGIASLAVTGALVSKGYSTVIIFQEMLSVITRSGVQMN